MSTFEQKKREMIEENEKRYGEDIRSTYGDKAVDASNAQLMNMSEEDFNHMQTLGEQILLELEQAVSAGVSPGAVEGDRIAGMHEQWLAHNLPHLTREIHTAIAGMYVADERFTAYYDRTTPGCAAFLKDAVERYWSKR